MKADQERVKNQLMQTVPLLCQLGLHFDRKLRISGYIKIHIDDNDKIVIDIEREYESSNSLTAENDDNSCDAITTSSSNITSTSANSLRDTTSSRPAEGTCSGQSSTCIRQQHNRNCNVQTQRSTNRPIQHKSSNTQHHSNISGQGITTAIKRSSFADRPSNPSIETTISTRMPQNEANDFKSQNTENNLHIFEKNMDDDDDFAVDDSTVTPTSQGPPSRQPTLSPSPAKKRKKCPVCKGTIFGSITAHMKKHQHSLLKVPLANGITAADSHKKIVNVPIQSSSSVSGQSGTAAADASKEASGSKTMKQKVKRLRLKTLAALSEEGNLVVERFTQWLTTRTNPTTAMKYAGEVKTVIRAVGGCTRHVNVESVYEKCVKSAMDDVQQKRLQRTAMANRLRRLTYFCDFALTESANDNDLDRNRYNHLKQEIVKWNKSLHKRNARN